MHRLKCRIPQTIGTVGDGGEPTSSERRSAGRRGIARAWRRDGVQRRRRELSRSARRAFRRARDPSRHLPSGGRRRLHGRGLRQADRQTGRLLVTRGPGACNASIGVHTAFQDSTPMVVLVGQVARHQIDREAFQEVDFRKMYAPLAKWVTQIDMAERVPELLNQAFQVATSGRPGPVVVALPEDMLRDAAAAAVIGPYRPVRAHPGAADLAELRRLLAAAERPIMLVGGSGWSDAAAAEIARFATANDLPVCCSFRRQDIVDNRLPCFVGDLGTGASAALVARFKAADLVLAVGARIGEITSQGYTLLDVPDPGKTLIHVHAAAAELGRVFRPTLAIQSGMPEFAAAVTALEPIANPRWRTWRAEARTDYEAGLVPTPLTASPPLDLGRIMTWLRERLPDDAIVTSDAG